jgi:hypothetical protein
LTARLSRCVTNPLAPSLASTLAKSERRIAIWLIELR